MFDKIAIPNSRKTLEGLHERRPDKSDLFAEFDCYWKREFFFEREGLVTRIRPLFGSRRPSRIAAISWQCFDWSLCSTLKKMIRAGMSCCGGSVFKESIGECKCFVCFAPEGRDVYSLVIPRTARSSVAQCCVLMMISGTFRS